MVGNKHITCLDASVLLMQSIVKREKDPLIFSFGVTRGKLNSLSAVAQMNFQNARKFCEGKCVSVQVKILIKHYTYTYEEYAR